MASPNHVDNAIYDLLSKQCPAMWLGFPIGTGVVYWVDSTNGDDGNVGTRPDQAFATIIFALTQCVNNRNDYIMVIDDWQEAAAIAINKTRVHIIGLNNYLRQNSNHMFVGLSSVTNDFSIFTVSALSNECEIAGFALGGGATNAGIENIIGAPMGLHIHDCSFGHFFTHNDPQDGIRIGLNATNIRIEHCVFLGTPHGKGDITRDGIHWECGGDPLNGSIEDNQFKALPGVGINFAQVAADTGGISILRNIFNVLDTVDGEAITLNTTPAGMLVDQNHVMYGNAQVGYGQNPYRDLNSPNNDWGLNYRGNQVIEPVIV